MSNEQLCDRPTISCGGWSLWKSWAVRSAGFPANVVAPLSSLVLATAVDTWLDLDEALAKDRDDAIAGLAAALSSEPDSARKRVVTRAIQKLRANNFAVVLSLPEAAALAIAVTRAQEQRAIAETILFEERRRATTAIRTWATDPRYREALVWQNRHVLHDGIDVLLRHSELEQNSKARQHERLVVSHLQRYGLKNESIGFFGPVSWAVADAKTSSILVRPGKALLDARFVHFEHWSIDAVAMSLVSDELLPHLAPRRRPTIRVDGTTLHYPVAKTSNLPSLHACVLGQCDGQRTASEIAHALGSEIEDPDEVFEILGDLLRNDLITWTIEISPYADSPVDELRGVLERVNDAQVAAPGLRALDELIAARDLITQAAGDERKLDAAFEELEATFKRITGNDATRRAGLSYAGRGVIYEDCRRDLTISLGPALIAAFEKPLAQVLLSARWYTYELARRYREALVELHRDLQAQTGSTRVDFLQFWRLAVAHFDVSDSHRTESEIVVQTTSTLQERWRKIFNLAPGEEHSRIAVRSQDIEDVVERVFSAPGPGWPSARHHSPDLMIAARDVESIQRGDFSVVAGELHLAYATTGIRWMRRLHPDPDELVAQMEADRDVPIVEVISSKDRTNRADRFSFLASDFDLEHGATRSHRPRAQVLEAGNLCVEPSGSSLVLVTRDGTHRFALEQFLDAYLTIEAQSFRMIAPAAHVPRVTIDNFVVQRETWSFDASAIEFARIADPLDRMISARRWARAHRIPNCLFYKVSQEPKPCFVDLTSPHFIELAAHLIKRASRVTFSEMLPGPHELWLPDAAGNRYTSEFRVVAVDPQAWTPA